VTRRWQFAHRISHCAISASSVARLEPSHARRVTFSRLMPT
jgi:hypothetical protein